MTEGSENKDDTDTDARYASHLLSVTCPGTIKRKQSVQVVKGQIRTT